MWTISLRAANYGFVKSTGDVVLQTNSVLKLYLYYATAVPHTGEQPDAGDFIATLLEITGA